MSIAEKFSAIAENEQKVYEAGQKSEYDRFWDEFQKNGTRTSYSYAFYGSGGWNNEIFKPKYDITEAQYCFNALGYNGETFDLIQIFKEQGIKFNKANGWQYANYMFYNANITTCPKVHISCPQYVFYNCKNLVTIEELSLTRQDLTSALGGSTKNNFNGCTKLENLKIGGWICYDFDVSPATALTYESLISIKNALWDYVGHGSSTTKTLTVGSTNLAKYTDTDLQEIAAKGWSVI